MPEIRLLLGKKRGHRRHNHASPPELRTGLARCAILHHAAPDRCVQKGNAVSTSRKGLASGSNSNHSQQAWQLRTPKSRTTSSLNPSRSSLAASWNANRCVQTARLMDKRRIKQRWKVRPKKTFR